jgi:predicted ATPase
MIREWSVEGFKSIRSTSSLPLAKITVFAGANSGGKSTFLQSILLLKQTLQYGAPNRSLSLNGPIMRLGTLDDVICASASEKVLKIGLEVAIPDMRARHDSSPWLDVLRRGSWRAVEQGALTSIHAKYSWSARTGSYALGAERLQSVLNSGYLAVGRSAESSEESDRFSASYRPKSQTHPSDIYDVELDPLTEVDVFDDRPDARVRALHVSHFLPSWVEVEFNETKQRARNIASALFSPTRLAHRSLVTSHQDHVPSIALELINTWLTSRGQEAIPYDPSPTIGFVAERLKPFTHRRNPLLLQRMLESSSATQSLDLQELQDSIEAALVSAEGSRHDLATDVEMPRNLSQASEFLKSFFKLGVRYLGPLRDEPRPVYPLEAIENPTDVGYRGEHTAAVLELNASKWIEYLPSGHFTQDPPVSKRHGKLIDAVRDWLAYLGVAEDVVAREEGVFGNRLQVTTSGLEKWHDLTNVGVGVSQVLPIVVSALLAPRSSMMIFEQPELHLHPRVQARLADFFISMAHVDKQCVLETHSEYLIERLRLRVAQSDNDLEKDLAIYFAERTQGETVFRSVPISRYGAIIEWPSDFFDQSQFEASKILEAAAKKRAKDRSRGQK